MSVAHQKTKRKECFTMDKKVLIISSSPRKGGNSETLAAAFAKGAREAGNQVETVYLREKQVGFCKGCLACLKLGHCVIQDDAVEIAAKMHDANVLVFATPVYYYCVSGQLTGFHFGRRLMFSAAEINRFVERIDTECRQRKELKNRIRNL